MAYIEFKNIVKEYKMGEVTIKALNNTNFEIEKSKIQKANYKWIRTNV